LALVLSTVGLAYGADNLAKNSGFEEWPPRPEEGGAWGAEGFAVGAEGREGAPDGLAYRTGRGESDTERRTGNFAQYIETHTYGRGATSSGIPTLKGYRYLISVWAKVVTGTFRMNVCYSHSPWTPLGEWVEGRADGEWTQFTKEVDIPEDCGGIAVMMFFQYGAGYLDDLEVVEIGPADTVQSATILLSGKLAPKINGRRVAIFDEPDFPSESPRSADWYADVLKKAGFQVTRLDFAKLTDPRVFHNKAFNTLIFPTGGNLPWAAEKPLVAFLRGGGTVFIDGNMMLRTDYRPPEEIRTRMNALHDDYVRGGDAFAYWDFVANNDTPEYANVFEMNDGRWHPPLAAKQNYEYINFESFLADLFLVPWPNIGQTTYARPFAEAVRRNDALGDLLAELPESVPAAPDAPPALRLAKPGGRGHNVFLSEESALDMVLPLYLFPDVSHDAYAYSTHQDAGKKEKDRDADLYLVRYNNPLLRGGTLIHMGNLGSRMLAGNDGARTLLALLRLAESQWPGEPPKEFVDHVNEVRRLFSDYAGLSLQFRDLAQRLARVAFYRGEVKETDALEKESLTERSLFDRLSRRIEDLNKLLLQTGDGGLQGDGKRVELIAELNNAMNALNRRLPELRRQAALRIKPPTEGKIVNPLDRIFIGLGNAVTYRGAARKEALRDRTGKMGLPWEGYGVSSYRHEYTFNTHPFKSEFESGTLDPRTGIVEPVKFSWMTTDEEREMWSRSFQWQLERVAKDPNINIIFGMDERNFAFSLWGPHEHGLFLGHLREKYDGDIAALNKVWGTQYGNFEEIQLPVQQPGTPSEHALWEDWTRFREIYRYEDEMMPSINTVKRFAPDELYLTWSTNYLNESSPASGLNFYEYGKALFDHPKKFKINGFEHANRADKEWLTFDIVSMFSRNCVSEWGAFYFPPDGHQNKVDLLSEALWNGIVNGQVGWDLFQFSTPGGNHLSYFDMVDLPLPLGWQLSLLSADLQKLAPIVLDGMREEPQVRIAYSNTTRRHTAWPEKEGDISFNAVGGLYDFFKRVHIAARAIDEQAVWEGHLPKACKLLILPDVLYQNQKFFEAAEKFLRAGGSVLVTTDSGTFDEYGRRTDSWLALAGVRPVAPGNHSIPLPGGGSYFSRANSAKMTGLQPIFPDEVEVLASFGDGVPALTRTQVGKGNLFMLGVDLGRDCALQWAAKPEGVLALLQPVLRTAGVEESLTIDVPRISARMWDYHGRKFLFLTDPGRVGFQKFEVTLAGDWSVKDYLLGSDMTVKFDGKVTRFQGLIASPGGLVYELRKGNRAVAEPVVKAAAPTTPNTAVPTMDEPAGPQNLPFEGRIWVGQDKLTVGDFVVESDVETGGGWGGETFLTVSYDGERHRRKVVPGDTLTFAFTNRRLNAVIKEVVSAYPGNVLCRLEEAKVDATLADCTVREEDFFGQKSVLVSNGLIAFRLVPALGGRMVELLSLPDAVNHLAVDGDAIRKNPAPSGWVDFGGMDENAGGWPGPFWNQPFTVAKTDASPDEVRVRLEMAQPVEWQTSYANPQGGVNRLVKEFTLRKGEARVEVRTLNSNEDKTARLTGLRTHPLFRIGGDAESSDVWAAPEQTGVSEKAHPFGGAQAQLRVSPAAGWSALIDTARRIALVNTFDLETVETLYLNTQPNGYNVELWAKPREIPAGGTFEFKHSLALIRGLSGVLGERNGLAANIAWESGASANAARPLKFSVQAGSAVGGDFQMKTEIRQGNTPVATFGPSPLRLEPGRAVSASHIWEVGDHVGGGYSVFFTILNADGEPALQISRPFQVANGKENEGRSKTVSEFERGIQRLREQYVKARGQASAATMRLRIARAEILLEDLRKQMEFGNSTDAEAMARQIHSILEQQQP